MVTAQALARKAETDATANFDAVIIGAGVSGLYQLYKLRELGLKVRVFETGTNVGGTWYWNRYPGARFDSESWTYGYSFSEDLLQEWNWAEHFASAPETERYLNYVADRFDLRRDIQFRSRVSAAHYREEARDWDIALEDGRRYHTRFLVTAIGVLSAPTMPRIQGIETFKGQSCHTANWPKEPVNLQGKRVAVIGTGATAVQTIQTIAKDVGSLTVFQRTPNWCAPLHNSRIDEAEMRQIRARYREIFARCYETPINETPIERITPAGIKTSDAEYEFDKIIYATGFDAITGAFDRIDIRGVGGRRLKDAWNAGPQTYLGVLVEGFPNMLMAMGPHAGLGNFPRAAEYNVNWVTGLIRYAYDHSLTRIEATQAGTAGWTEHVKAMGQGLLANEVDSWMTGINRNIEGKQTRKIMRYSGGYPAYREHCDAVAADNYRELMLD